MLYSLICEMFTHITLSSPRSDVYPQVTAAGDQM